MDIYSATPKSIEYYIFSECILALKGSTQNVMNREQSGIDNAKISALFWPHLIQNNLAELCMLESRSSGCRASGGKGILSRSDNVIQSFHCRHSHRENVFRQKRQGT